MENTCPKCGKERDPADKECFSCGIVYEKYREYLLKKKMREDAKKAWEQKIQEMANDLWEYGAGDP